MAEGLGRPGLIPIPSEILQKSQRAVTSSITGNADSTVIEEIVGRVTPTERCEAQRLKRIAYLIEATRTGAVVGTNTEVQERRVHSLGCDNAIQILVGEGQIERFIPSENHITLFANSQRRWNVIAPPIENGVGDPYPCDFSDWVQCSPQNSGDPTYVLLPLITPASNGLMCACNSNSDLGGAGSINFKTSSGNFLGNGVNTGVVQTVRGGALIFISDGVDNWIRYFSL